MLTKSEKGTLSSSTVMLQVMSTSSLLKQSDKWKMVSWLFSFTFLLWVVNFFMYARHQTQHFYMFLYLIFKMDLWNRKYTISKMSKVGPGEIRVLEITAMSAWRIWTCMWVVEMLLKCKFFLSASRRAWDSPF